MKLLSVFKKLKQLNNNSKHFAYARAFFRQHLSMQHEFQHLFRTRIFTCASLLKPKKKTKMEYLKLFIILSPFQVDSV